MILPLRAAAVAAALALGMSLPRPAAAQAPAASQPTAAATGSQVKDLPLTAAERQAYLGSYTLTTPDGQQMIFRVFEEEGVLKGQPGTEEIKRLLYQGENVFRPDDDSDFTITFTMDGSRASKFVARSPEMVLQGVRTP